MASRKAAGHPPLADTVYQILLNQFMDGSRPAGQPLNIAVLARELDVSQTPIREALARLEHTGLVQREALKGYRVAALFSEDDLVALMEARAVLEPAVTLAAGRRVTPEFLAALRGTIHVLDAVSTAPGDSTSLPRFLSADERFHTMIAEHSGNQFLAAAYASLGGQVQRFRLFAELGSADAEHAAGEHRQIYEALAAGDADLAADLMRQHVRNAGARALKDRRDVRGTRPGSAG